MATLTMNSPAMVAFTAILGESVSKKSYKDSGEKSTALSCAAAEGRTRSALISCDSLRVDPGPRAAGRA